MYFGPRVYFYCMVILEQLCGLGCLWLRLLASRAGSPFIPSFHPSGGLWPNVDAMVGVTNSQLWTVSPRIPQLCWLLDPGRFSRCDLEAVSHLHVRKGSPTEVPLNYSKGPLHFVAFLVAFQKPKCRDLLFFLKPGSHWPTVTWYRCFSLLAKNVHEHYCTPKEWIIKENKRRYLLFGIVAT